MLSFPILFIFFSLRKNIHDLENPKMAEENKTHLIKCQNISKPGIGNYTIVEGRMAKTVNASLHH